MEVGSLVEWFKEDGERVEKGEILFSVEGEKAIQDVEALESGVLRIPPDSPPPGEEVPVGTLLGYILQPDEPAPFEKEAAPPARPATEEGSSPRGRGRGPTISPRARRVAKELGVDWTTLQGSGRTGRIVERDVREAAEEMEKAREAIKVSPVARRVAERAGVDLSELAARKQGQRITRQDVEEAIGAREEVTASSPPTPGVRDVVPVVSLRRVIAHRMAESAHTTAPLTLTTEADATELVALREGLKAALGPQDKVVPTYDDLILKLTGAALQEHPQLNAYWRDDEIILLSDINIGMAVDTEEGLLVPVIHDVPAKGVQQIAEEARSLVEKARARQLAPEDMEGGTFTVTNLGMYNIDAFTPIINLPESAILGVGRILRKPAVIDDQLVPRHLMALSLTFDHRVVDGGPAARFLDRIRAYVERPYLWLAG